jgi:glycosyltransferase involved in cell wall biosynthesis
MQFRSTKLFVEFWDFAFRIAAPQKVETVTMTLSAAKFDSELCLGQESRKPRLLFVSQYDLYPYTVGGLPIRCREFNDILSQAFDVHVLSLAGVRDGTGKLSPMSLRPFVLEQFAKNVSSKLGDRALSLWDASVPGYRVRQFIRKLRPGAVFFGHFEGLPKPVFRELLMIPGPIVAYFGNSLGGALLDALEEFGPKSELDGEYKGLHSLSGRPVTFVFNCDYLQSYYRGLITDHFSQRRTGRYSETVRDYVIYDGADTDRFHPADELPHPVVFAFLGRPVHPGKGFFDFCQAMTLLPENCIGGIEIIGDGNQMSEGLKILKEGGRSHLISRAGGATLNEAPERLRRSSVMVLPTRDDSIPIAVTEAMATGLAVVTTRLAGIPELVRDGETGLLVDPGDVGQIVRACRLLAENHSLAARLGTAARALVVERFQRRKSLDRMASILSESYSFEPTAAEIAS